MVGGPMPKEGASLFYRALAGRADLPQETLALLLGLPDVATAAFAGIVSICRYVALI
jgi:hypothetical protein